MKANCYTCGKEFEYNPHHKKGKFCSNPCQGLYKTKKHREKFWAGTYGRIERVTARKYLAESRGYKCEVCGISEWQNKKITLQVDHTNGDPSNDHPDNLRLICPNCHSQTEFLGAANKGRGRGSQGLPLH
jgi:hypothetical protein